MAFVQAVLSCLAKGEKHQTDLLLFIIVHFRSNVNCMQFTQAEHDKHIDGIRSNTITAQYL